MYTVILNISALLVFINSQPLCKQLNNLLLLANGFLTMFTLKMALFLKYLSFVQKAV